MALRTWCSSRAHSSLRYSSRKLSGQNPKLYGNAEPRSICAVEEEFTPSQPGPRHPGAAIRLVQVRVIAALARVLSKLGLGALSSCRPHEFFLFAELSALSVSARAQWSGQCRGSVSATGQKAQRGLAVERTLGVLSGWRGERITSKRRERAPTIEVFWVTRIGASLMRGVMRGVMRTIPRILRCHRLRRRRKPDRRLWL